MSLETKVQKDMVTAMKAKDKASLEVLRAIKSSIIMAKTEAGSSDILTEDQELKLLQKLKKQRQDAALIYREQNRSEMADEEESQILVIDRFLPEQMSEAELETVIKEIIEQTGANSMKDMGKVMGMSSKKLAGKADGKAISGLVKKLLA